MLNADEDRLIAIMDDGAACLGLVRHGEELHHVTSLVALDRHSNQRIDADGTVAAYMGDDERFEYCSDRSGNPEFTGRSSQAEHLDTEPS